MMKRPQVVPATAPAAVFSPVTQSQPSQPVGIDTKVDTKAIDTQAEEEARKLKEADEKWQLIEARRKDANERITLESNKMRSCISQQEVQQYGEAAVSEDCKERLGDSLTPQ